MSSNCMETALWKECIAEENGDHQDLSMEVAVLWNDTLQKVVQVEADNQGVQRFFIGEDPSVDFIVPMEMLEGETKVELMTCKNGLLLPSIQSGMKAAVVYAGGERIALACESDGVELETVHGLQGIRLSPGSWLDISLGPFHFRFSTPQKQAKFAAPLKVDWSSTSFFGISGLLHAVFLLVFFLIPPEVSGFYFDDDESQSAFMKILLAPPENRPQITPEIVLSVEESQEKSGERHVGGTGAAGRKDVAKKRLSRLQVKGPEHNQRMIFARDRLKDMAKNGGVAAVLAETIAPSSPFGAKSPLGRDPENVLASLVGDRGGPSFGFGGLGPVGTGRGGGGNGKGGIGLGRLDMGGMGRYPGHGGELKTRLRRGGPKVRVGLKETGSVVKGSIRKDVIRRMIHLRINEVKHCYDKGLLRRSDIAGRVTIKFIISSTGVVQNSVVTSSTVGDPEVASCIARVVRRITFPRPEDGAVVIVTYPFALSSS